MVIGHNSGAADEQRLSYAESDAQRFADVLGDVGSIPSENLVFLRGKTADQVRSAMIATNERIRTGPHSGADAVLFVYYSGHGDADALHLGDTRLPLREFEALVRGSPAALRVLVVDSCRSGSVTRVKGGRPAAPLALDTALPELGEGMIVLTASTLTEDAQESEQLGGSIFTHYLLSGLRGAADDNGDRVVTVAEAFSYTHDQTVVASSRTLAGTQHPTFHYDLRGRADLSLADLRDTTEHGTLSLPTGATWLIMRTGSSRTVVGEIAAEAHRRTLNLRPGSYALRGRTRDALLEGAVTVSHGSDTTVDASKLQRTTYARLLYKGEGHGPALEALPDPPAAQSTRSIVGYNLAIGGLGIIIGSLVIGGIANSNWTQARHYCPRNPCDDPRGVATAKFARTLGDVATGTFVAGSALVVFGVTLLVTAQSADTQKPPPRRTMLRLIPHVGATQVGMTVQGGF